MLPIRAPAAVASLASAIAFLPQASKLVSGTSLRAGIEPFLRLKLSWKAGSMIAAASLSCASSSSSLTFIMPNASLLKVTAPCVPG